MKYRVNQNKCIECYCCMNVCSMDAIQISKKTGKAWINPKKCIGCGECADECPVDAIKERRNK